jgi:hypothetical protein
LGGRAWTRERNQLDRPSGIAINADDHLVVVDHLNHRVQTFTLDGEPLGCCAGQIAP